MSATCMATKWLAARFGAFVRLKGMILRCIHMQILVNLILYLTENYGSDQRVTRMIDSIGLAVLLLSPLP